MKIGCCGSVDQVQILSELGFEYIEPPVAAVADEEFSRLARATEKYDLKPEVFNCFLPASLPVVGPDVNQVAICKYLNKVLPRIESLGGEVVVFGSGKARKIPQGFSRETATNQLMIFLEMAVEAAGDRIRIVIEPLHQKQTNLLNQVAETRKICEKMGWRVGILADLFHMTMEAEPIANLIPVSQLGHTHVPLPEETFALDSFLDVLKSRRYGKRVSLEDNSGLLARTPIEDHRRVLENALEYIKGLN